MGETLRVGIVEDNAVFREALVLLLGGKPGVEVAGAVGSGEEAVTLCRKTRLDVVLLDYRLPGMNGVETTRAIRAATPGTAVVGLTASATVREIEALKEAGALACLTKDARLDDIVAEIRIAAAAPVTR
ncbi:MAG: response regulator transcription factor [Gaiellaceae bacterium]